jgi:hypothetical protein
MSQKMMGDFKKHPNVARTSKVGEPNLSEEEVRSAAALVKDYTNLVAGTPSTGVGIEAVGTGSGTTPGANQPAPSSQNGDQGTTPPPAPAQVNEVKSGATGTASDGSATPAGQSPADAKQDSTSKKKGKKGLRKLVPF